MSIMPDTHPDRIRLDELVAHCRKRCGRAAEKLRIAHREQADAHAALNEATRRIAAWVEANPEPQMELL